LNRLDSPIEISNKVVIFGIICIVVIGLTIRFFYFPYGVPLSLDSISYFSYAVDISQNGKFPSNYDLVNNGWPTFLSPFFTSLKFDGFIEYMNLQRIISLVISCITVIPVYILCRKFFSKIISLVGAALFILEPRVISNSLNGITEPLYVLLGITCLVLFFSERKWMYLSFLALALFSIVRYEGLIFIIPLSIMYFVKFKKEKKKIIKYVFCISIFILVILPMATIRVETMGADGFVSHYIATDQGSVLTVINEKVIQGLPDDDKFPGNEGTNRMPEFISTALSKMIINFGMIHIPLYVFFVPIGLFFIFWHSGYKKMNYKHLTLILFFIFGLLPILYTHGRFISDLRYYLILYPIIILIALYGIEKLQLKINIKKTVLLPLMLGILVLSVGFLELNKSDLELERESFEITNKAVTLSNALNGQSLYGNYITTVGIVENWPEVKKPIDVKKNKISPIGFDNLKEFIIKNKEKELDHIVVDNMNNGPEYIQEIFDNEKDYPYLEKVFDSKKSGYEYHVKIFKINFEIFDGRN
tara:strand:+ start:1673 stop:3265 length:1593 start_codon:yes stop_codon:yes gene_type:complete